MSNLLRKFLYTNIIFFTMSGEYLKIFAYFVSSFCDKKWRFYSIFKMYPRSGRGGRKFLSLERINAIQNCDSDDVSWMFRSFITCWIYVEAEATPSFLKFGAVTRVTPGKKIWHAPMYEIAGMTITQSIWKSGISNNALIGRIERFENLFA